MGMGFVFLCFLEALAKVIPSHHLSPLQNQNLMGPKKNGLMEMILLQNQEPEFYNILYTPDFSLQNQRPIHVGQKGFPGNYPLQNQIHSLLLSQNHYRIKIWRYDI